MIFDVDDYLLKQVRFIRRHDGLPYIGTVIGGNDLYGTLIVKAGFGTYIIFPEEVLSIEIDEVSV